MRTPSGGPDTAGISVKLDSLIGSRVSLRHRVGERDGRPLLTDAVGELADGGLRDGEPTVVVTTRRGPVVVARAAVVAVRAVPPAAPKRASWTDVERLQSLCADAWPALAEQRLGAWRLRAAAGFTAAANAAVAVGDPGCPVPTALARVRAFAAAHDVPARVLTPTGSPWSRAVAAEGWVPDAGPEAGAEGAVLVLDLEPLARPDGPGAASLAAEPDDAWWAMTVGGAPTPVQRHVLAGPGPVLGFGSARGPDCEPVGALRTAVVGDHLHLSRLTVTEPEPARRNDTATALTTAAARWGRDRGARWAVLQVALVDADTRGFYEGLGAVEHHRYHYLVRG